METIAILALLVTIVGCSKEFHSRDRVLSVTTSEACVERIDHPQNICFDPSKVDGGYAIEEGDCVQLEHADDRTTVVSVTRVDC